MMSVLEPEKHPMEQDIPFLTPQQARENMTLVNTFLPLVLLSDANIVHSYFIDWSGAPRIRIAHSVEGDPQKVHQRVNLFLRVLAPNVGMELNPADPLRYSQNFSFDGAQYSAHQKLSARAKLLDYLRADNISFDNKTTLEEAL